MRRHADGQEAAKAPRPDRTEHLRRDLERSEGERQRLEREVTRLHKRNKRLEDDNARLKRELDAARRAGCRQAAPFAKPLSGAPKRPGRRAGAAYGVAARRRAPARVDERHRVPLPPACPDCGGVLQPKGVATQVQEELPVPRVVVRQFEVAIGACRACGRRVQGRHRLQSSDALGAAGVQLGPQLVAWAVILNKQLGLSFGKVATLLRQHYGVTVSRSGLVRAVDRAGRRAQPTYAALQQQLRRSRVVTPDETGWKVAGRLNWLWVAATPQTTVYQIQPGRGYAEAAKLLGADFAGVLVRDGWAPYRRFTAATHQSCLAHLLRRAKTLRTDHPYSRVVVQIQTALQQALRLRDEARAATRSPASMDHALDALATRLAERIAHPGPLADVQRFANHLITEWTALFNFLRNPAIDATNWRAEQAIRPAVVTRKVCGGNRSWRGAHTQQILTSLIRTATQRQLDPHAVVTDLLRTPAPTVAPDLQGPAP